VQQLLGRSGLARHFLERQSDRFTIPRNLAAPDRFRGHPCPMPGPVQAGP
jgi:hypothetical protein